VRTPRNEGAIEAPRRETMLLEARTVLELGSLFPDAAAATRKKRSVRVFGDRSPHEAHRAALADRATAWSSESFRT